MLLNARPIVLSVIIIVVLYRCNVVPSTKLHSTLNKYTFDKIINIFYAAQAETTGCVLLV